MILKSANFFIYIFFLILLFAADIQAKEAKLSSHSNFFRNSTLGTKWGLSTWRWKEGLNDSLGVLLKLRVNWEKELSSGLIFHGVIDFNASKSRLQQHIFGKNASGVYSLKEAKLVLIPLKQLSIEVGVLSEAFWQKGLLISSSSSFIGIREFWNILDRKNLHLNLQLEQSIPPSSSSDNFRLENEAVPYFTMGQFSINYTPKQWRVMANVFYSHYFNLPAVIAFESSLLGNETRGEGSPSNTEFISDFGIIGAGTDIYYPLWKTGLKSYFLWNHKAQKSINKSRFVRLYFDHFFIFSQDLTLALEEFFIEPDATVSYYNNASYGNTNREGFAMALSWKITKFSQINLRYIQSDIINIKGSTQDQLRSVSVGLESNYDFF